MRPHIQALPLAGRLRGLGCPSYLRTADALRTGSLHSSLRSLPRLQPGLNQRRWITLQHLRRMEEAKRQWAEWAKEIKEGKRQSFLEHIESRGLVHDVVGDRKQLNDILTNKRVGMYAGVDPTGPSLHVGHVLPFMILAWGYVWGLPVTWLLGGATARVGDPTGRMAAREDIHSSVRKANMASMHLQLKKMGASVERYGAKYGYRREWAWRRALENNNTWWNKTSLTEVLRDMGSFMRIGPMLGRETVKNRMNSGEGMSFGEFAYPLLQAWDWWTMFNKGVQIQIGGQDQYGNILFGIEAVKEASKHTKDQEKVNQLENPLDHPVGITTPLLTAANGEKIGKSAGNGIWLDQDMTSPFDLYQYFVHTPDDQVERYLKLFTFIPLTRIATIMEAHNQDPSKRGAQHILASEFVEFIHGAPIARDMDRQVLALFGNGRPDVAPPPPKVKPEGPPEKYESRFKEFQNRAAGNKYAPQTNFANMTSIRVTLPRSLVVGRTFNKILHSAGLVASRSEGHRLILNNGALVGCRAEGPKPGKPMPDDLQFIPISQWHASETKNFIVDDDYMLLRVGKWKYKFVTIVSDEEFQRRGLDCPGWNSELGKPDDEVNAGNEQ